MLLIFARPRRLGFLEFGLWLILSSRAVSAAVSSLLRTVTASGENMASAVSDLRTAVELGHLLCWPSGENTRANRLDACFVVFGHVRRILSAR